MHFIFDLFPLREIEIVLGRARAGYGDGSCLELFLVSLLTGWQLSGHMYGFNSSCFSAGVFAIGR